MNTQLLTGSRSRHEVTFDNGAVAPRIFLNLRWKVLPGIKLEQPHPFDFISAAHRPLAVLLSSVFHEEQVRQNDAVYIRCDFEYSQTSVTRLLRWQAGMNVVEQITVSLLEGMTNAQILGLDFGPWHMVIQIMHAL